MTQGNNSLQSLLDLSGKGAIVTGGAKGLGLAIAQRLGEAGASVCLADIDDAAAGQAAAVMTSGGAKAITMHCDISREDEVSDMVGVAALQLGSIDILVNNAGIFPRTPLATASGNDINRVLEVNLTGTFLCCRYASAKMIEQGEGGSIINIASIDALHPSYQGMSAYDASKGGVVMLTRSLARELGKYDIRVNAVAPGGIKTEGARGTMTGTDRRQELAQLKDFLSRMVLGRMGEPDEIARVVLFLASDLASYVTGSLIVADGGYLVG